MNSADLNAKLSEIADESDKYDYEAFGGKAIPYIGWFWRTVDFDYEGPYPFGILPVCEGFDGNDTPRVGFMENNKWDYEYVEAAPEEWKRIKELLTSVAENPCRETLAAADAAIQALLKHVPVGREEEK